MNELIQQLLGKDDGTEYAMTRNEQESLQETLAKQEPEASWTPDRKATEMAIREMIMRHPTEFEQLLRKHHDLSNLEFKSVWLEKVNSLQIA